MGSTSRSRRSVSPIVARLAPTPVRNFLCKTSPLSSHRNCCGNLVMAHDVNQEKGTPTVRTLSGIRRPCTKSLLHRLLIDSGRCWSKTQNAGIWRGAPISPSPKPKSDDRPWQSMRAAKEVRPRFIGSYGLCRPICVYVLLQQDGCHGPTFRVGPGTGCHIGGFPSLTGKTSRTAGKPAP